MTNTIHIGEQPSRRPTKPITYLPTNLTSEVCLSILASIDPDAKTESIAAAGKNVNLD